MAGQTHQQNLFYLTSMGFDAERAEIALITNEFSVEDALDHLMAEMAMKKMDNVGFYHGNDDDDKEEQERKLAPRGHGELECRSTENERSVDIMSTLGLLSRAQEDRTVETQDKVSTEASHERMKQPDLENLYDIVIPDAQRLDDIINGLMYR